MIPVRRRLKHLHGDPSTSHPSIGFRLILSRRSDLIAARIPFENDVAMYEGMVRI